MNIFAPQNQFVFSRIAQSVLPHLELKPVAMQSGRYRVASNDELLCMQSIASKLTHPASMFPAFAFI